MNKMLHRFLAILLAAMLLNPNLFAKDPSLTSPNRTIELKIELNDYIRYSFFYNKHQILKPSPISMRLGNGIILGHNPMLLAKEARSVNEILTPVIKVKSATIQDHFNELILHFKGSYALVFRAYDDGIAYRFKTTIDDSITVISEEASFNFKTDSFIYFPEEEGFFSHLVALIQYSWRNYDPKILCSGTACIAMFNYYSRHYTSADS